MNSAKVSFDPGSIQQVAKRILADYDAHRPNAIFAERGSDWLTLSDAYLVQRAVAELRTRRGERRVGYKVGCISATIQQQLELNEPVRGYLWQSEVVDSGTHLFYDSSGTGRGSRFVNLAIEGEIGLRLGREISSEALQEETLADCVQTWFPVIELHNAVFRGPIPTSQELVAGNAMHTGFVTTPSPERFPLTMLNRAQIRVEIDGKVIESKSLAELPGGPQGSLCWLAHSLSASKEILKEGDIVLTGSPGRLIPVVDRCHIVVSCEGQRVEAFIDVDQTNNGEIVRGNT